MRINVEEKLIEQIDRNTLVIDNEIQNFLESDEGQNIRADIQLLNEMGFNKKMINKVYILLRPENIERAIDYMTEINGKYQHNFIDSTNPKEKNLCFICKRPRQNHMDYIPNDVLNEENINFNTNEFDLVNEDIIEENKKSNDISDECEVCFEEINKEDKIKNAIPCGHLFCTHCWFNYLKTSILDAKVDEIKCMNHGCKEYISNEFILKQISEDNNLIEKYLKFKRRSEIIKDENKKLCPNPDCDSYLQKSENSKYVKCENGHIYCYECLKPPHGNKSCDYTLEKEFMKWKEGKRVKRCPRCKIYTEKNEGCNHMTCVSCKYQWCWLCEGKYSYGHYDAGKCSGQQFTKADSIEEIEKKNDYCGLHKIFGCVFFPVERPTETFIRKEYPLMLKFWLFGIFMMFNEIVFKYFERSVIELEDVSISISLLIIGISLNMFFVFQFSFFCLLTPFILISFIFPKFFDKILLFFEF